MTACCLQSEGLRLTPFPIGDAAHRLVEEGMRAVDPEHLAFDADGEYPPEIVAVAQSALDRVFWYIEGQSFGD